jgi:hypothetical protein
MGPIAVARRVQEKFIKDRAEATFKAINKQGAGIH